MAESLCVGEEREAKRYRGVASRRALCSAVRIASEVVKSKLVWHSFKGLKYNVCACYAACSQHRQTMA
jgi:hypothetical protein